MSFVAPVALAALAVVAVLLPWSRSRRWLLAASKAFVYLVVVAAILTAALFALLPATTPVAVQPLTDLLPTDAEPLAWPLLAALVVAVALPLVTMLDVAQRLARHAAFLDKLALAAGTTRPRPVPPAVNGHEARSANEPLLHAAKGAAPSSTRAPLKQYLS